MHTQALVFRWNAVRGQIIKAFVLACLGLISFITLIVLCAISKRRLIRLWLKTKRLFGLSGQPFDGDFTFAGG